MSVLKIVVLAMALGFWSAGMQFLPVIVPASVKGTITIILATAFIAYVIKSLRSGGNWG